jgi:hypothetical protein
MKKVFIGGSRRVSRLNAEVRQRLDNIIAKRFPIVIGDANGADRAVQQYLLGKEYADVEVFCVGGYCRNNVGNWPSRKVAAETSEKNFQFYATKDRTMAREASVGLMIWDGQSVGTLLNVLRLLRQNKKVVVYEVPGNRFWELKSESHWKDFVLCRDAELRRRVEREAALEDSDSQRSMLLRPLTEPVTAKGK